MTQVILRNLIPSRACSWLGFGEESSILGTVSYKLNDFMSDIPILTVKAAKHYALNIEKHFQLFDKNYFKRLAL